MPPENSPIIDWRQTFFLNFILQYFHFTIEFEIADPVKEPDGTRWKIDQTITYPVYASPSKHSMDKHKGSHTEITFPDLYFTVDNFDQLLQNTTLAAGQRLFISLVSNFNDFPHGKCPPELTSFMAEKVLFDGSVTHTDVRGAFWQSKQAHSFLGIGASAHRAFIGLNGPHQRGKSQIAIQQVSEAPKEEAPSSPRSTALPGPTPSLGSLQEGDRARTRASTEPSSASGTTETKSSSWSPYLRGLLSTATTKLAKQLRGPTTDSLNVFSTFISLSWMSIMYDLLSSKGARTPNSAKVFKRKKT